MWNQHFLCPSSFSLQEFFTLLMLVRDEQVKRVESSFPELKWWAFLQTFSDWKWRSSRICDTFLLAPWFIFVSESENHSVVSSSLQPHGLYSPWNSPGQDTAVGSLSLLRGIFPTQGSNPGPPRCRQSLYQLSHKGKKVKVKSLSRVWLFATPWIVVCEVPPSMEFPRQEYWVCCHFLHQGIYLTQGSNLGFLHYKQIVLPSEPPAKFPKPQGKPMNTGVGSLSLL